MLNFQAASLNLGINNMLVVSAFSFESFNLKLGGSEERANSESRIKERNIWECPNKICQIFCESYKS